jgi:hypothetical protein
MNIYLIMIFGGLLGIIAHAIKTIRDINRRNENVNFGLTWRIYWRTEWFSVFVSVFCYFVLLFIASEFVKLDKIDTPDYSESIADRLLHFRISGFIKLTSVLCGYFADSLVYGFIGVTEKKIKEQTGQAYIAPNDAEQNNK